MYTNLATTTHDLLRQQLAGGGTARLRVSGDSMAPLIGRGDEVIVEAAAVDELHIGDVVVFDSGNGLLMHRLLARQAGRLVTRGDRMATPDHPWASEQLLGRVRSVLKGDGRHIALTASHVPRALRWLWQIELRACHLARVLKRRLPGDRLCRCLLAVARLITAPSRCWLRRDFPSSGNV
ncbi:MAG: S24/S26 family peptidase [Anaerolineae bacterium]|nr:S24/S26 family peptidase [Anaerolineae bacterium]